MGGTLDGGTNIIMTNTWVQAADLNAVVVSGHGDTMIPWSDAAHGWVAPGTGKPGESDQQKQIAARYNGEWGVLFKLLIGTSAWYAPGAAGAALVKAAIQ